MTAPDLLVGDAFKKAVLDENSNGRLWWSGKRSSFRTSCLIGRNHLPWSRSRDVASQEETPEGSGIRGKSWRNAIALLKRVEFAGKGEADTAVAEAWSRRLAMFLLLLTVNRRSSFDGAL